MFETAELGRKVSKAEYEEAVPSLRADLLRAQNELQQDPSFSVIIVINGVDGAGKGETVNLLHEWMDPRYLSAHAFGPPSDEEVERPEMWRFWRVLPPRGRIGTIFGSWYTRPILAHAFNQIDAAGLDAELRHINTFERELVDDGTLLLKFWFHLSKKIQKKRLRTLAKDPLRSWRVTKRDWQHFEMYDRFRAVCETALRETSTGETPWTIVEGSDARYRELTVGRHLLDAITRHHARAKEQAALRRKRKPVPRRQGTPAAGTTILDTLDLTQQLTKGDYKVRYAEAQGRLNLLSRKAQARGVTSLVLFEGADAAGKGGAIRRITRSLDARYYGVVPIAAPTDEEAARHYLWRFWRHLPRAGHMTIFDRTWYGRVLVERVEGFATDAEWQRAFKEIYEFEELLCRHGISITKFWLHIDPNEQLKRFKEREKTSYKMYKITREDYRNRAKSAQYVDAVHEMVERTSTTFAPWTLVEANDKYFARIKVMDAVSASLEAAIKAKGKPKKQRSR